MRTPPTWTQVFMDIARAIAQRSKDPSTQAGAVIVNKRNRILGSGFNGPPPQINDDKVPWEQRPEKYGFILHAEENAIFDALSKANSDALFNSTLYCTHRPCAHCTLLIVNMNIAWVVYPRDAKEHKVDEWCKISPVQVLEAQKLHYFDRRPTEFIPLDI